MAIEHELDSTLARAVRIAGSQSAFGRLLKRNGKPVRQSTVREWLKKDSPLPAEHVLTVEAATGIPKEHLRPDIYRPQNVPVQRALEFDVMKNGQ